MSSADTQFSKARLEMLCDGIFAIAMTLLVLELKPPDVGRYASSAEILAGLREHVPPIVGFVMSFILAGQFWLLHHISLYQPFSFLLSMGLAVLAPRQTMAVLAMTQAGLAIVSKRLARR